MGPIGYDRPVDTTLWLIIAGVALAAIIAGIAIVVAKRRTPELPPSTTVELPPAPPVEAPVDVPTDIEVETQTEVPTDEVTPEPVGTPVVEAPEAPTSRLARLRRRLADSNNALARALADLLSSDRIDDETWDDFETTLITSDLGVGPTTELVSELRHSLAIDGVADAGAAREVLRRELVKLSQPDLDRSLNLTGAPAVILVVGVNGTGKTTTVGKIARMLIAEGKTVLLGAADTFRAAAVEQLATWGDRVGVETVRGAEGADPASVAFAAVERGMEEGIDVVIIDTAGRLHTKTGLMDELGKVKRVIEKKAPVSEVLLVLDATTGQNGLTQARIFAEVVDVTGIVLTKLDGSAKGGIVVQVQRELGVPVKFIGLGEGADDLAPFEAQGFVAGLLGE